ncbi:MAG: F0F1 ATP synthase subunit epsilon [Planctomycetes bacterium]|nr:F0F1 ATP synthase subunit epsilon [Planctomycetota bacterium]NOG53814.1 F0F1 ATP synthase subunit epsilon [Planctomycetota bacterium]
MAKVFHCSVVTPEEKLIDGDLTYASLPAWDGQYGIAPGKSPLLVKLGIGQMRLDFAVGGSRWYLIEGGYAQMIGSELTILSGKAHKAENLTESDAQKELDQALELTGVGEEEAEAKRSAVETARQKRHLAHHASHRGI